VFQEERGAQLRRNNSPYKRIEVKLSLLCLCVEIETGN
jgi:hypothetical protein